MIFDAERTEREMRRHRVYRRKRGKIYAASRLDHCTNGDPMFVILIIVTIVIVVIVPCIRWLRERACWNEGFAGITIDCSLCSCSSVSPSLSLSLSLFSYVSLLLLYMCSHIYPRECICSYTHTRYATHVTVYIENVYACMYNISIETRRFSILQVCNVYAGQWSGRRAIFALCPAGWKRRERRTIETGKVRAKLAGKRDARGFYAHVEENLYRKREFSLFLFSFLLLRVFLESRRRDVPPWRAESRAKC